MEDKLYTHIARKLDAMEFCKKSENMEWFSRHRDSIDSLVKNYMPSGSGIDSGTSFDLDNSTPNKLVFTFGYHHMDENGYYNGWTEHKCIVTPSLASGTNIWITGRDKNNVKEYLYQTFESALDMLVEA